MMAHYLANCWALEMEILMDQIMVYYLVSMMDYLMKMCLVIVMVKMMVHHLAVYWALLMVILMDCEMVCYLVSVMVRMMVH